MLNPNMMTVSFDATDAPSPVGQRCELKVHDQTCTGVCIDLRNGVLTFEMDDGLVRWIAWGVGVEMHRIA